MTPLGFSFQKYEKETKIAGFYVVCHEFDLVYEEFRFEQKARAFDHKCTHYIINTFKKCFQSVVVCTSYSIVYQSLFLPQLAQA